MSMTIRPDALRRRDASVRAPRSSGRVPPGRCGLGLVAAALLSLTSPAGAAPAVTAPPAATEAGPVALPQTNELAIRSAAGLDYRIFVYAPSTPPPPAGFPIIYVLDGNAWFAPMAHSVRLLSGQPQFSGVSPAIIVGIGYPGDAPFSQLRRFFDFIPDIPLVEQVPAGFEPPRIGGADQFLGFIRNELEPLIEQRHRVDRRRRTLFGHSLGCSLTLHVLFTQPDAFPSYVCASASLHFNGEYILREAERFIRDQPRARHAGSLVYAVAEYDERVPESLPAPRAARLAVELQRARIVTSGRALAQRLEAIEDQGLETSFLEFAGENHITEVPVLINRMLPLVLRPAQPD